MSQPEQNNPPSEHTEANLGRHWYLLTAKPNQDQRAEQQLQNQGYTVYRPLARIPKIIRGKRSFQIESLFPRYLFIQLDQINDNWSPIRSTRGVAGFVKFGTMPSVVPDKLVDYLMQHEQEFESRAVAISDLKSDDSVEITGGAFRGCEGIFQHYDGEQRALVLLQFLGQQRPVKVDARFLKMI